MNINSLSHFLLFERRLFASSICKPLSAKFAVRGRRDRIRNKKRLGGFDQTGLIGIPLVGDSFGLCLSFPTAFYHYPKLVNFQCRFRLFARPTYSRRETRSSPMVRQPTEGKRLKATFLIRFSTRSGLANR